MSRDAAGYAVIDGLGTPEEQWQAWPGLQALPAVQATALVPPGSRLVVLAPHPDDEVLAVGGLIAQLAAAGRELLLVAVTDGTASHPGSARWTPAALAATRPGETADALRRLGVGEVPTLRLGLPDSDVAEAPVIAAVAPSLRDRDVLVVTWRHDGHPDHEAVGRAGAALAAATGAPLLEVPVWTWHWARPGDARVPWERARRVELDAALLARKRAAVEAYASQLGEDAALPLGAVLPPPVLARLLRPAEVVLGGEG